MSDFLLLKKGEDVDEQKIAGGKGGSLKPPAISTLKGLIFIPFSLFFWGDRWVGKEEA